jgi:hypothetical protein
MALALDNYNRALAGYDFDEADLRRILANRLGTVSTNRKKGLQSSREGSSARGLLHSSIALNNQSDIEQQADDNVGELNANANAALAKIARMRADAQANYQQQLMDEQKKATQTMPTFDPADPYNWKGIAAAHPELVNVQPSPAPAPNPVAPAVKKSAPAKPKAKAPVKPKAPTPARYGGGGTRAGMM